MAEFEVHRALDVAKKRIKACFVAFHVRESCQGPITDPLTANGPPPQLGNRWSEQEELLSEAAEKDTGWKAYYMPRSRC